MKNSTVSFFFPAAALCLFAVGATAQSKAAPAQSTPAQSASAPAPTADRAQSYYHMALAHNYEEKAEETGRQQYVTRAIEEYKLALDADPDSAEIANALAMFYFRAGRIAEAISTARDAAKRFPKSLDAHKLLGQIYLRSIGDGQGTSSAGTGPNPR